MPEEFHPNSTDAVLARIEERQKNDSANIKAIMDNQTSQIAGLEKRVTSLERWKFGIMGGAAVVAFAFRSAWEWFTGSPKH